MDFGIISLSISLCKIYPKMMNNSDHSHSLCCFDHEMSIYVLYGFQQLFKDLLELLFHSFKNSSHEG